jgi:hypothetical protein
LTTGTGSQYAAAVTDTVRVSIALVLRGEVQISAHGYDEMAEDGILAGELVVPRGC